MSRLTIFAKGNLDVRDTLHSLRVGDKIQWNGINEIVRAKYPGTSVRVRHETWARSDALLGATGTVPPSLRGRQLQLGAFPFEVQFSDAIFRTDADVIILSIQPDLASNLVCHRRDGYRFYPNHLNDWSPADLHWLRDEFAPVSMLDVAESMNNVTEIINRIRTRTQAPILFFNCSSVVPGDSIHCYAGMDEIYATRIRRFNLGLVEVSQRTGISVVDVDRVIASGGADRLKLDAVHLSAEGCKLVAAEVVRILDDLGCFPPPEVDECK